jgi:hypothetical protein
MPTTSQGLLIVKDTAPEVFFSISATAILSPPVITIVGVNLFWLFLVKAFLPLMGSFTHRLSAGLRAVPEIHLVNINIMLIFIVQWIYVVVTIEQTIQRNPVIQNGPRFPISFGQVRCSFQVDYTFVETPQRFSRSSQLGLALSPFIMIYESLDESHRLIKAMIPTTRGLQLKQTYSYVLLTELNT